MTEQPLEELERQRAELYARLAGTGDFRPGSVNETWRRCGKPNCACAQPGHPGHGPRYLWTRSAGGRTRTRQLAAAELGKVQITERAEAVIDRDDDHVALAAQVGSFIPGRVPGACDEGAAVAPEHDRTLASVVHAGGP